MYVRNYYYYIIISYFIRNNKINKNGSGNINKFQNIWIKDLSKIVINYILGDLNQLTKQYYHHNLVIDVINDKDVFETETISASKRVRVDGNS